ncbi:LacI family DNA-binding transcriptional regulator [Actinomadura sp. NTSP31]|uniref:LacI family DNA-binding transcriptional regulator n=1 Tax=Actinomadura sp. NTSP31 TaxID=1735447 RepID=UPI0035BF6E04
MAGKKAPRRVTSADVARESGLSRATVSFVLNDKPNKSIPPATRERVLQAAARLGYTPYAPARTLRSGRSDIVVLVLPPWPQGPTVNDLVERAAEALTEAGYTLVTHVHSGGPDRLAAISVALAPAALVGLQPFSADELDGIRRIGTTKVFPPPESSADYDLAVTLWSRGVGRLQAEHLIARGHTRIAYALPDDPRLSGLARGRLEGVTQACAEAGLPFPVVSTVPLDTEAAARVVEAWRATASPSTAVCAYNDEIALAVLAGMRTAGLSAPADLAVIGADDITAARFAVPPLTTVAIDSGDVGADLARALLLALDGGGEDFVVNPRNIHVIERESV